MTMAIKEITPQQAHETLSADKSVVYIDVRTAQEFANGHPAGAVNIPVAFADPARGMVLNPRTLSASSRKTLPKTRKSSSVARPVRAPLGRRVCC